MRNKRFVLDANIFLSHFINGTDAMLASYIVLNNLEVLSCKELTDELLRIIKYKHLAKYKLDAKLLKLFMNNFTTFKTIKYPIKNYIPEDADDNYLIALALQNSAGFITSGDKHILSNKLLLEKKYKKLKIITKLEFENMF